MDHPVVLLLFFFLVWITWIPAVLIEKKAAGDDGYTSILPVIPLYPLVAWGAALGLNRLGEKWGTFSIGGIHVVLLFWMLFTIWRSWQTLRQKRAEQGGAGQPATRPELK